MVYGSGSGGGGGYKSYDELKALTLSEVIEELNTDAQGYYDNLNGNGKILGIGIGNSDNTTYQCWDVSPVIFWNGSWRNGEIIIAKIKTDSSGNLMIPKAGYSTSGSQNASYNWWVSYDGGNETQYSGTGSAGSITIASGLTADTEHTIVIRPNSESYGWGRAFGFHNSGVQTLITEIVYDSSYVGYGTSDLMTGGNFRGYQYRECTSLTTAPQEVLPNSVTSIGDNFRRSQYYGCTGLITAPQEVLPNSVTSIVSGFRYYQYYGCTSLTTAPQEVLPNSVTSIGSNFRGYQYYGCTSLTTAPQEVLPNSVTSIGSSFRYSQYYGCTSLTTAPQEVLPNSVTSIVSSFRYSQYYGCTSLTTAPQEVLPNSVTSIGGSFRRNQYRGCTSLITAPQEVLPNLVTSIGDSFRRNQYDGCTSLNEIQGIKDLSIGNKNYRSSQFTNCFSSKTVKVLSNVGYDWYNTSALPNSYVIAVLVPSAYLQNFKDATTQPRTSINDSKFVGY